MATLTPISEALNRSTPGFDALMGAIQNQTNRIIANKQFAKELQARKEFAIFQNNLQMESEIQLARRMMPIEEERAERLGEIQKEDQKDLASYQSGIRMKEGLFSHMLKKDLLDYETQQKIEIARNEGPDPSDAIARQRLFIDIREEERADLESRFPNAVKVYGAIVQTQLDGTTVDNVPVEIGADTVRELDYGSYLELLRGEEQRLQLLNRYERALEDRKDIVPGSTEDQGTLGFAELETAIRELRAGRGGIIRTDGGHAELMAKYQDQTPHYLTPLEKENRELFSVDWKFLTGNELMDRTVPPYTRKMLEDMGEAEAKNYLKANMLTVNQTRAIAEELDTEQETDGTYLEAYNRVRETWGGTQPGLQETIGDQVFNYNFDPIRQSDYSSAVVSKDEMADMIWNNIFSNDPGTAEKAAMQGKFNMAAGVQSRTLNAHSQAHPNAFRN